MPSLTLVLIIVGAALVGVVLLYNYIQEERFRRQASRLFSRHDEDILLGEAVRDESASQEGSSKRVQIGDEAVLAREAQRAIAEAESDDLSDLHAGDAQVVMHHATPQKQPVAVQAQDSASSGGIGGLSLDWGDEQVGDTPVAPVPSPETLSSHGAPPPLDLETECIARLRIASPSVAGLATLISALRRIGKPLRGFGQRPDGSWEPILADTRGVFAVAAFGLQLADRSGPTSLDQINAFCRHLYEFAAEDGGAVSCPDKAEMLRRAADLDAFCMDVDILIGLTLTSSDARPFTSEAIHGPVSELGMQVDSEGVYVARDGSGLARFTLCNQETAPFPTDGRGLSTHAMILQLDVPRATDGLGAFDQMSRLAFDLSVRLQGKVVDQKGRPWSDDHLARDRSHLADLYARMQARGIPAGGERALRLFR